MDEAVYPLTLHDNMFAGIVIVIGWLVEGSVDILRFERALDTVTAKWKLLNGRIEKVDAMYQLRVCLHDSLPKDKRFALTSTTSNRPLSDFVALPLGLTHDLLPSTMSKHPKAPSYLDEWINDSSIPLTHWHVTYFPGDQPYSCIGLTFPHVVFDGLGIAAVIHAVESELLGQEWRVPEPLNPGYNENLLVASLKKEYLNHPEVGQQKHYNSAGIVGKWWTLSFSLWSYWQAFWKNVKPRMLIIPTVALRNLVDDARQNLVEKKKDSDIHLSKGDIISAFLFKIIFSDENLDPNTTFHLGNLASLRRFFNGIFAHCPHNCVAPFACRPYTARELRDISVPELAYHFYQARQAFTVEQALQCNNLMLEGAKAKRSFMFFDPNVNESAVLTNMTIGNVANINWTGSGAGRTLCRYKTSIRKPPFTKFVNLMTIVGYLDDGSLLLQLNLGQRRFERLAKEVQRLIDQ